MTRKKTTTSKQLDSLCYLVVFFNYVFGKTSYLVDVRSLTPLTLRLLNSSVKLIYKSGPIIGSSIGPTRLVDFKPN